jgi:hypothetical protein
MKQDTIQEIVEKMFDTEYMTGKQPNLNQFFLLQSLTSIRNETIEECIKVLPCEKIIPFRVFEVNDIANEKWNDCLQQSVTNLEGLKK